MHMPIIKDMVHTDQCLVTCLIYTTHRIQIELMICVCMKSGVYLMWFMCIVCLCVHVRVLCRNI